MLFLEYLFEKRRIKEEIKEDIKRERMMKLINKCICTIVLIVPTMYFGCLGKTAEMGIVLVMGTLVAAFLNLEKFSSFKGGGFEAQLREVKETADKAVVTMEKLEKIIKPLLLNSLHMITYSDRLGGGPIENKDMIRDGCQEIISVLNISDENISQLISTYNMYSIWDMYSEICMLIPNEKGTEPEVAIDVRKELEEIKTRYEEDYVSMNELNECLERNNIEYHSLSEKMKELIDEYEYRLKNNTSIHK